MESRQLWTFINAAKTGSFSKAAENLGYTQAAVTIQIKNLEEELGVKLFDRIGKRVTLTVRGERLLKHAHNIFNEVNIVKNEQVENPSMIIVGEVVNVREKIQWFEKEQYYKQLRQEISV